MNNWPTIESYAQTRHAELLAAAQQARRAAEAQGPAQPGRLTRLFARLADGLAALLSAPAADPGMPGTYPSWPDELSGWSTMPPRFLSGRRWS